MPRGNTHSRRCHRRPLEDRRFGHRGRPRTSSRNTTTSVPRRRPRAPRNHRSRSQRRTDTPPEAWRTVTLFSSISSSAQSSKCIPKSLSPTRRHGDASSSSPSRRATCRSAWLTAPTPERAPDARQLARHLEAGCEAGRRSGREAADCSWPHVEITRSSRRASVSWVGPIFVSTVGRIRLRHSQFSAPETIARCLSVDPA